MDEGREDRTQIEDVITLPKTDHKVNEFARQITRTRVVRTNMDVREAIPGNGVVNTGTVLASSCGVMLLDVTLSAHPFGRRSPLKVIPVQPIDNYRDARDVEYAQPGILTARGNLHSQVHEVRRRSLIQVCSAW